MAAHIPRNMPGLSWRRRGKSGPRWFTQLRSAMRQLGDMLGAVRFGERGVEARARNRFRKAGLPLEGITIESWKGVVTLRGDAPAERLPEYTAQARRVRGVEEVMNFIRAEKASAD